MIGLFGFSNQMMVTSVFRIDTFEFNNNKFYLVFAFSWCFSDNSNFPIVILKYWVNYNKKIMSVVLNAWTVNYPVKRTEHKNLLFCISHSFTEQVRHVKCFRDHWWGGGAPTVDTKQMPTPIDTIWILNERSICSWFVVGKIRALFTFHILLLREF